MNTKLLIVILIMVVLFFICMCILNWGQTEIKEKVRATNYTVWEMDQKIQELNQYIRSIYEPPIDTCITHTMKIDTTMVFEVKIDTTWTADTIYIYGKRHRK